MPRARKQSRRRLSLLVLPTCLFLALGQAESVSACLELPLNPPEVWVSDSCINGELIVVIHDYTTFGASNDYCACALNLPLLHGTVVGVDIIDLSTGLPMPEFMFTINRNADFGGSNDWQGLATGLTTIPPGREVDLRFRVVPPPKNPCPLHLPTLIQALQNPPAPGLIGTGGANSVGMPTHHVGITNASFVGTATIFWDGFESGNTSAW